MMKKKKKKTWTHNDLHDLESLWWVATWMLCYNSFRCPKKAKESNVGVLDKQLLEAAFLFPPVIGQDNSRYVNFTDTGSFRESCGKLSRSNKTAWRYLDKIRIDILQGRQIEATLSHELDFSDFSDIYQRFEATFKSARDKSPNFILSFIPKLKERLENSPKKLKLSKKLKRPRATSGKSESSRPRKK